MDDPVSTPEAIRGLVAALEKASANLRSRADYIWNHVDAPGALGSASGLRGEADKLDEALAAWRSRIKLADDNAFGEYFDREVLTLLDARLSGEGD